jgi:hypothetical protein
MQEWINSEGSPNSVTSKNGSFFACDSSSFISPISNHTTSLFSPPGSTFLQQHSPNLKALDASANLPKSSQSAGGGLSNFGGFENFLASSFNTHSNNNNAQSVPPYEVIKEQLLAILQYQQKAKAQQEQHQQQQSCLSQLIDSVKSETPFVNKLITKQDANKPTRSNEFNPSLPLPPSTPATTRSAASSQFQFPQQYLPIIQVEQ